MNLCTPEFSCIVHQLFNKKLTLTLAVLCAKVCNLSMLTIESGPSMKQPLCYNSLAVS